MDLWNKSRFIMKEIFLRYCRLDACLIVWVDVWSMNVWWRRILFDNIGLLLNKRFKSWSDHEIMRLIVDFILYLVELWCHSRSLSVTYAMKCSYGSSHLSISNWLVVIPFHIPHVISHVEKLEFSEAGQIEGRIKAASSNFQDKWRMEMVLKYNPPGSIEKEMTIT